MNKTLTLCAVHYMIIATWAESLDVQPKSLNSMTLERNFIAATVPTENNLPPETLEFLELDVQDPSHIKAAKLIKLGLMLDHTVPETIRVENAEQCRQWIGNYFLQARQNLSDAQNRVPTASYFVEKISHLIPPFVKGSIRPEIIISSDITAYDPLNVLAFKLKKLGMIILILETDKLASSAPMRDILAAQCFIYAGKKINEWIQKEKLSPEKDAEAYEDAARIAQNYYKLAIAHLNPEAAKVMAQVVLKMQEKIDLARQIQLFSTMKSGFSNNNERQYSVISSRATESSSPPVNGMDKVLNELKSRDHAAVLKQIKSENRVDPIRHFFPQSALKLSDDLLAQVGLEAHDSPYKRAFKISKLAMNLRYTEPPSRQRDRIISDCYELAGDNLGEALKLQRENVRVQLAPELLMDTAMTAGQFYIWAAKNSDSVTAPLQHKANILFQVAVTAITRIPTENYDWRVIGDATLREVILGNLDKIIRLYEF